MSAPYLGGPEERKAAGAAEPRVVRPFNRLPEGLKRVASKVMCQYCGCRDMPLIRDYIAEHAHVLNLGGEAVRAIDRGDIEAARRLLTEMGEELRSHWRGEENGLFKVMAGEEMFAEHIDPLIREHRELDEFLATVDVARPDHQAAIRDAVEDLWEHTRKEEDGIFPAALTSLDGDEWNTAIEAWHEAHPDREMVKWSV